MVSIVSALAIAARLIWPELKIDAITLGLMIVGLLPWLFPVLKSAELPGGWKIEFREIQAAAKGAAQIEAEEPGGKKDTLSYLDLLPENPALALAELRIEIEKKVRRLAELRGLPRETSINRVFRQIAAHKVLEPAIIIGLLDLVDAANRAIHGAEVEKSVTDWVYSNAGKYVYFLDRKLNEPV